MVFDPGPWPCANATGSRRRRDSLIIERTSTGEIADFPGADACVLPTGPVHPGGSTRGRSRLGLGAPPVSDQEQVMSDKPRLTAAILIRRSCAL